MKAGLLLILLLSALLVACDMSGQGKDEKKNEIKKDELELVRAEFAQRGTLVARLEITARVEALEKTDIIPRLEGTIVEVLIDEGKDVRKGDLLARIEDDEAEIKVAAQKLAVEQAGLAISTANLAKEESEAMLEATQTTLDRESNERNRARAQHKRGAISDQDKEAAEYNYSKALADKVQAALAAKRSAEAVLKAGLEERTAKNALKAEQLQFSFTRLTATIGGRLLKRNLRLGQKAVLGQAAFTIADLDSLVVRTKIPETELRVLSPGLLVHLEATAYPEVKYTGKIDLISSEVDADGGQIDVRIKLDDGEPPLMPGMFVSGHIITEERQGRLLVPRKAMLFDRDRPYIYIIEKKDGKDAVKKIYMRRGLQNPTDVEYLPLEGEKAQIDDTTRIVVVGLDRLIDGTEVEIDKPGNGKSSDKPGDKPDSSSKASQ